MTEEQKYYLDCGILNHWHDKTFDDFTNDEKALEKIKKYLNEVKSFKQDGIGVYLWGINGCGKSHLLNCAFKELINKRYKVRIISFSTLITNFSMGLYDANQYDIFRQLKGVDFLGIEEIGKELPSKEGNLARTVFDNVVRYRLQSNKPTWFTTNVKPSTIQTIYSEDITSMLKECVFNIEIKGVDYRDIIRKQLKSRL